ncbi:unnamed protein product [Scytosiphon promiscuus]
MASYADQHDLVDRSQGRRGRGRENPTVQLSKRLTRALRHDAKRMGLNMRPDGFVDLDELLGNPSFRGVSKHQVEEVVASCEKGRMTLTSFPNGEARGDFGTGTGGNAGSGRVFIRANQGHSVKGVVDEEQLLTRIDDAVEIPVCVHGTDRRSWPSIRKEGLKCMKRTHIHFAAGLPGEAGVISGMRKSCKVFIYVDVAAAMSDGIAFFRSSNNVILTAGKGGTLEPRFFSRVEGVTEHPCSREESQRATHAAHVASRKHQAVQSARETAVITPAARRQAAAAAAAAAATTTKKQPRAESAWMLHDREGLGAGAERNSGGRGSGSSEGKPAAEF